MKKDRGKRIERSGLALIALAGLVLFPAPAASMQESIQIHGFGGWAYGHTDGNKCAVGKENGTYNNSYFALNVSAFPYEKFSANVQTLWRTSDEGLEMEFDYAFAEWAFFKWLKLRIGKVKSPFGLYTEIFDVGTLRPFYLLPRAVYGSPGMVTKSYYGAGLTGSYRVGPGWRIHYDLYGGQLHLQDYSVTGLEEDARIGVLMVFEDMIGGRVMVDAPLEGLRFGGSLYNGQGEVSFDDPYLAGFASFSGRYNTYNASAEYATDCISVRAEYVDLRKTEEGDKINFRGYYIEAAYLFLEQFQVAALFNHQKLDLEMEEIPIDFPDQIEKHKEYAVGFNYWFTPLFVVKLSYHHIEGNPQSEPKGMTLLNMNTQEFPDVTHQVIAGAQFSF